MTMARKSNQTVVASKAAPGSAGEQAADPQPVHTRGVVATNAEGMSTIVSMSFLSQVYEGLPSQEVYDEIKKRTDAVQAGSMDVPERMLMGQALALQTVFTQLMNKAASATDMKRLQPLLQLALKAQSNCRVTLETLNEFKNPRAVAFVRQTNVAHGPQQVNYNAEPGRALKRARGKTEKSMETNELLEAPSNGKRVDTGAQSAPGTTHSKLEPVEAVHRPAQPARKAKKLTERQGARAAVEGMA
jgi:hypothetical protein